MCAYAHIVVLQHAYSVTVSTTVTSETKTMTMAARLMAGLEG
jgi:hypothetical protein